MSHDASTLLLTGLAPLAARYDGFILDLWGVLHDGERPYPGVADCLDRLAAAGKRLCLLSNAPRRVGPVAGILAAMGITADRYHHLVTSGEATFEALAHRPDPWHARLGRRCLHLGPEHDRQLFEDLPDLVLVTDPHAATFVLNTGPSTYEKTPEDYGPTLDACARLRLPMVCANPDLEVMVGPRRVLCAGTLAKRYEDLGGSVRYHGKPYAEVYRRCLGLLGITEHRRILAIGDSLHTDVAGAIAAGLDSALVTGGIHCRQLGGRWGRLPDGDRLATLLSGDAPRPTAVLPCLVW